MMARKLMRRTTGAAVAIVAAFLIGSITSAVFAQLPTFSTGHLVTAAEFNAISTQVNTNTTAIAAINSVPSGTIGYFNAGSCPTGWAEFTTARGLYIVGRVSGGTLATAVGSALSNQESRTHNHTEVALSVPSLSVPSLSFSVTTSTDGAHGHTGTVGVPSAITGVPTAGATAFVGSQTHTHTFSSDINGSHSHSVSGSTSSGSTGTGTTGSSTTGNNSTDVAPYIQLLVCQKT